MSQVLICGAAGYTNRGDDAILWGMLTQLQAALGVRPVTVLGGPELVALTAPFGATALGYDDRAEVARAIEEADLVLLGGGGLLYDVNYDAGLVRFLTDPPDRQWLYEMAKLAAAARAAGRPVMAYALGVGPLYSESARRVARYLAETVQACTVRDRASADLLADCGVSPARVQVTADPAIAVQAGGEETARAWLEAQGLAAAPRPWIGLNLRPWGQSTGAEGLDRLLGLAGGVIRELRARVGGTVVLLPFQSLHDDDAALLRAAAQASGETEGVLLAATPELPPDLVAAVAHLDLMVGMRMHSVLLATAAGVPFVALSYDAKVAATAEAAGLHDHCHSLDDLDPTAVAASCEALLTDAAGARATVAAGRERLREAAALAPELAKSLLETGRAARPKTVFTTAAPVAATGLRVLMQIRPDFREKPGGDVVQLEEIVPYLREAGVTVELTGEAEPDLSPWDLVHTIDLGRPEEPYEYGLRAIAEGKPVVFSTVHIDMTEFLEWGDPEYWELPDLAEGSPVPRRAPPPHPVEQRRRALRHLQRQVVLDGATVYLPNAQFEADYLHAAFGMDLDRTLLVPNALRPSFFDATPDAFVARYGLRDFVVCASARVEARKNQLLLIAALRGTDLPLVIIGQPNPQEYMDLCRRYAGPNVTFLDARPHAELGSVYAAAKVHALPSWFESPGLVSLEAAAAGCNIVSTDRGSPREYLQDMAWYCDPRSVDSIREAVLAAYAAPRSERLREHVRERYTWARAAERTLEGYRLALALHADRGEAGRQEEAATALRRHAEWLERLAGDRRYELQQMQQSRAEVEGYVRHLEGWGHGLEARAENAETQLQRAREELTRITSRRAYRAADAVSRLGWGVMRRLGRKT